MSLASKHIVDNKSLFLLIYACQTYHVAQLLKRAFVGFIAYAYRQNTAQIYLYTRKRQSKVFALRTSQEVKRQIHCLGLYLAPKGNNIYVGSVLVALANEYIIGSCVDVVFAKIAHFYDLDFCILCKADDCAYVVLQQHRAVCAETQWRIVGLLTQVKVLRFSQNTILLLPAIEYKSVKRFCVYLYTLL